MIKTVSFSLLEGLQKARA